MKIENVKIGGTPATSVLRPAFGLLRFSFYIRQMKLFSLLTNKYLLAGTCFVVWMVFFDHNDLFSQLERRKELKAIEESKQFFVKQIAADRQFSTDLQSNAAAVEKYTREKYLMKRDNEDLFLIQSVKNK